MESVVGGSGMTRPRLSWSEWRDPPAPCGTCTRTAIPSDVRVRTMWPASAEPGSVMVVVAVQKLHAFTCARIYGLACMRTYHIGGLACGGQFGDGWMHWHGEGQAPLPSTHISHAGWACDQTNARQVIKTKRVAILCQPLPSEKKRSGTGLDAAADAAQHGGPPRRCRSSYSPPAPHGPENVHDRRAQHARQRSGTNPSAHTMLYS